MRSKDHPEKHPQNEVSLLTQALSAPFDLASVKFKPAVVNGNRCLALAYVDARVIQDRLDEVLGVEGWQDDYEILSDGSVVCRLRLRLGEEWITKVDVGSPSEQPDGGDRLKAAFSDALKRAAVKFGVGRYLYRLPSQWVDYDPKRRQMVSPPTLPAFARPQGESKPRAELKPRPAPEPKMAVRSKTELTAAGHTLPANGAELMRRLQDYDAKLAAQGLCQKGDLLAHIEKAGTEANYGSDLATWTGPAIRLAVEQTRVFESQARQRRSERKEVA